MKSLVLILVLAAASMSAHVPEERALLPMADPELPLITSLLNTLQSVLGPIAVDLMNVVTSLTSRLMGTLLGTALAVVQGLLANAIGIVSKLVNCVTPASNIPVGNIEQFVLGTVESAVSSITSNLTEACL